MLRAGVATHDDAGGGLYAHCAAHTLMLAVVLAGGGALLHGLDARLSHETGMPIVIAPNPLDCVAIGSGQSLEEFEALKQVLLL